METAKIAKKNGQKTNSILTVIMENKKIGLLAWREMETLETGLLAKNCYHKMLLYTFF